MNNFSHSSKFYPTDGKENFDSNEMAAYGYPSFYPEEDIYGGSNYSAPPSHSYDRPWASQYTYQPYSAYNYGSNFGWEQNNDLQAQMNPQHHGYGSGMY